MVAEDRLTLSDVFVNTSAVYESLISLSTLAPLEAELTLASSLNLTQIVTDFTIALSLNGEGCSTDRLGDFVLTDDLWALNELSKAVCNLEPDDIVQLVETIEENVDFEVTDAVDGCMCQAPLYIPLRQ